MILDRSLITRCDCELRYAENLLSMYVQTLRFQKVDPKLSI